MNGTDEANGEAEIKTPVGSIKWQGKRVAELIAVLSLGALLFLGYVWWEHKQESSALLKELHGAIKDMVSAQREQNCLIAIPQEIREQRSEFCKRLSR